MADNVDVSKFAALICCFLVILPIERIIDRCTRVTRVQKLNAMPKTLRDRGGSKSLDRPMDQR